MTFYINTPASNATITVNSIGNVIEGPVGQSPQGISGGDTDDGYYTVDIPWNVNLNGTLYNSVYVSTNSFMAFGSPAITGSPTSPQTDKIFLGNRKNTTVPDTYAKNFYPILSGLTGNRTLRLRYEGGFKTDPLSQTSTEISYTLLGKQSLQSYTYNNGFIEIQLPWNVNFNLKSGEIQNTIRIYTPSLIFFGKGEVSNGNFVFTSLNQLSLGNSGFIDGTVGGVWAGIEGTAPNRTYRIRFEGDDLLSINTVEWEVILYENDKNKVDVHVGHLPGLIEMGWFGQSKTFDLTNTSGDYKFRGTRFSQEYGDSSLVWESTFYENNPNRIDVQLGEKYDNVGLETLTWSLRTSGTTSSFIAVTYGGDYYVAALSGSTGNITASTDGITWIARTSAQTQINALASGFINNQNVYVSGGPNGRVTYSTDTIVWSLRTSAFGSGSDAILSIGFHKNLFLAVGGGQGTPVISTSTNGIIWSKRTSANFNPSDNTGLIYDVSYSNNEFLTCGTGIAASTDTIHWARRTLQSTTGVYIAIGSGNGISVSGNFNSNLITSTDNIVWEEITPSPVSAFITDIQYLSGYYVVAQSLSTSLLVSTNALSWYNVPAFGSDITYGNNKFVAVGNAVYTGILESPLSTLNYYYGIYSKDSSLYDFLSDKFAGYSILSSFNTSVWTQPQAVYAKLTPLGLSSQWQRIRNIYVRDSDVWKLVQPPPGPIYFFCRRSTYQNDTYGNKGGTGIASFQNESFVVPSGVTTITVELWGGGGSGGSGCGNSAGGNGGGGGYVKATLSVTPGETLTIRVGGGAGHYAPNIIQHPQTPSEGPATINVVSRRSDVNINNQSTLGAIAGSGGGYSAIFRGLTPLLVAGGGGGGGSGTFSGFMSYSGDGGAGGGNTGQNGADGRFKASVSTAQGTVQRSTGGSGGSQVSGGIGGSAGTTITCVSAPAGENGSFLQGGRGTNGPSAQGDNLIKHGSASNPGTNGGAAGGGSSRTGINVCNDAQGYLSDQSPIDPAAYKTQPIYFYFSFITFLAYDNYFYLQNALYTSSIAGGGGGGGYYGGGGGSTGYHAFLFDTITAPATLLDSHSNGGSGGGGGSNYVGGAASVISNSQGNGRTPGNISSPYYLTTYLNPPDQNVSGIPFNAFAQGGVGYGGIGGFGSPLNNIAYGTRGENGLVVINW